MIRYFLKTKGYNFISIFNKRGVMNLFTITDEIIYHTLYCRFVIVSYILPENES